MSILVLAGKVVFRASCVATCDNLSHTRHSELDPKHREIIVMRETRVNKRRATSTDLFGLNHDEVFVVIHPDTSTQTGATERRGMEKDAEKEKFLPLISAEQR